MSDCTPPCRVFHCDDSHSSNSPSIASTSSSERLLYETNMPENSKQRVDLATGGEGLSGSRCLIENTDEANVVHYAHCLARGTKDHILDALEFSWGMDRQTLNLDTRCNIFRLGSKFHALHDKRSPICLLLPEESITKQYHEARSDPTKFPDIKGPTFKYHFLADGGLVSVPIHRLTPSDNLAAAPPATAYTYFAHPYANLDPLTSHLHPRYVICDIGKKLERLGYAQSLAFSRLHPNHADALIMVGEIWTAWTTVADSEDFKAFCKKPYAGDNMSSTSQRTAKRRLSPPYKKRGRDLDESPSRGSKRSKAGQSQNDCIWLDDETLTTANFRQRHHGSVRKRRYLIGQKLSARPVER